MDEKSRPRGEHHSPAPAIRKWALKVLFASLLIWLLSKQYRPTTSACPGRVSQQADLDTWLEEERGIAYEAIMANIGLAAGAGRGLVIASPSRGKVGEPDYFYTWTRDSALTVSSLLPSLLPGAYLRSWEYTPQPPPPPPSDQGRHLETLIRDYVASQAGLQVLETRSGGPLQGSLNEPKFEANGTAFNGEWGRPQRDGPALRVLTLIPYAHYLLDRGSSGNGPYVRDSLYNPKRIRVEGSVIKNDLEEVAAHWADEGFDVWEEVNAHHLFTRLVSLRALQAGAILAARLDDIGAAEWYAKIADRVEARLAYFWVYRSGRSGKGYWTASVWGADQIHSDLDLERSEPAVTQSIRADQSTDSDTQTDISPPKAETMANPLAKRTGLDCAFCLAVIHAGGQWRNTSHPLEQGWTSFEPSHQGVLSTMREYALSFQELYPINAGSKSWTGGWVLGRYAGDVYDGVGSSRGNPWFICTFSFAHTLYLAHRSFVRTQQIQVQYHALPFWQDLLSDQTILEGEIWRPGVDSGGKYEMALERLWATATNYLEAGRRYAVNGRMSEQIDWDTGDMRGARDLTWSYASFLELVRAREQAKADWMARQTANCSFSWLKDSWISRLVPLVWN